MIKQCKYMGEMRLGSDVSEKQERVKTGSASKRRSQRITNQPLVLPPNLNYPVALRGTSQQRMFVALPLGNCLPSKDPLAALTLGQAAPLLATKSCLRRSIGLDTLSFPSMLASCLFLSAAFLDTANFPEEMD